jgi:hypothetical protein
MDPAMMDNGERVRDMDKEHRATPQVSLIKEIGRKINLMDTLKLRQMMAHISKEIILMVRNLEGANKS